MFKHSENTPNIRVLGKRLVVEVTLAKDLTTAGGIVIPQEAIRNPAKEAFVVGVDDELVDIPIGSKVLLRKYLSQELHHDGREYRIVDFDDVLAVVPADFNATFTVAVR